MSDYGLDPKQLLVHVIRRTLQSSLQLWSPSADVYLDQIDRFNVVGPALGLWQMEGQTHADIHLNYLRFNRELQRRVWHLASHFLTDIPDPIELVGNLNYACAMNRVHYYRVKQALPPANDARAMAEYWKQHYNTPLGKGTVAKALPHFEFAVELSKAA